MDISQLGAGILCLFSDDTFCCPHFEGSFSIKKHHASLVTTHTLWAKGSGFSPKTNQIQM